MVGAAVLAASGAAGVAARRAYRNRYRAALNGHDTEYPVGVLADELEAALDAAPSELHKVVCSHLASDADRRILLAQLQALRTVMIARGDPAREAAILAAMDFLIDWQAPPVAP